MLPPSTVALVSGCSEMGIHLCGPVTALLMSGHNCWLRGWAHDPKLASQSVSPWCFSNWHLEGVSSFLGSSAGRVEMKALSWEKNQSVVGGNTAHVRISSLVVGPTEVQGVRSSLWGCITALILMAPPPPPSLSVIFLCFWSFPSHAFSTSPSSFYFLFSKFRSLLSHLQLEVSLTRPSRRCLRVLYSEASLNSLNFIVLSFVPL